MAQAVDRARNKEFLDAALISAISHPVRVNCLGIFLDRVASPKEIAAELELPIQNVAYHIRELDKMGLIELVRTEKRRSTEHFYRIVEKPILDADALRNASPEDQAAITANLLRLIGDDVNRAMSRGTIDEDDNHISRTPLKVDKLGWVEVVDLLTETLDKLFGVEARSVQRRVDGESDPDDVIPIKVEIIHFRSPTRT